LTFNKPSELNTGYQTLNATKENPYAWNYAKLDFEKYIHFKHCNWFTFGLELEAVYSSKKHFKSSLVAKETGEKFDIELYPLDFLTTPQFLPFRDSERFLFTFHTASSYIAIGLDPIFHLIKKLQLRFPFYLYNYFFENSNREADTIKMKINPNFFFRIFYQQRPALGL
jgi:hypothetical protein